MRKLGRAALSATVALALALTAACGSGSHKPAGLPVPVVNLASLDVGNLTTQPKYYGKPTVFDMARQVEAMRMGGYIPLPVQVDPEVKYPAQAMGVTVRTFVDFGSQAIHSRVAADPAVLNAAAKDSCPDLSAVANPTRRSACRTSWRTSSCSSPTTNPRPMRRRRSDRPISTPPQAPSGSRSTSIRPPTPWPRTATAARSDPGMPPADSSF